VDEKIYFFIFIKLKNMIL